MKFLSLLVFVSAVSAFPHQWQHIESVGKVPLPRYGHSWEVITDVTENTIGVLFGGYGQRDDGSQGLLHDIWKYDSVTNVWEQILFPMGQTFMSDRAFHTCTTVKLEGKWYMYCFGGKVPGSELVDNDFFVFDFEENQWSTVPDAIETRPSGRMGHTAIVNCQGNKLIIYGGYDGRKPVSELYMFDFFTRTWEKAEFPESETPPARMWHSALVQRCEKSHIADTSMIIFGGRLANERPTQDVWRLKMGSAQMKWYQDTYRPDDVPVRYGHAAFDIGDLMLVWGGSVSDANTWWYNENYQTWSSKEPSPPLDQLPPQLRFSGVEISGNKVYVFGGLTLLNSTPTAVNDVWAYELDPCMYHADCAECSMHAAECGWCSSKHACLTGDRTSPHYEICPKWGFPCPTNCNYANCTGCTDDTMDCGWCFNIPSFPFASSGCLEGSPEGPWVDECLDWAFDSSDCPECPPTTNCYNCLSSDHCGFCATNDTCMPLTGKAECPDWVTDTRMCNTPTVCSVHGNNCSACVNDPRCGWCTDPTATTHCIQGTTAGPTHATCTATGWSFNSCSPLATCQAGSNCFNCVDDEGCGWCDSTRQCLPGDKLGPAIGSECPAVWQWGTCMAPRPSYTVYPPGVGGGWVAFVVILILLLLGGGVAVGIYLWRRRFGGGFQRIR